MSPAHAHLNCQVSTLPCCRSTWQKTVELQALTSPRQSAHAILQTHTNTHVMQSHTHVVQGIPIRKIPMSVKFVSAILGPEMAAPILWTPGKMRSFCRKSHVRKIPPFRGGVWECRFYFYGRADFLILRHSELSGLPNANAKSPRFSYAISQIAPMPPVAALNRNSKSQIAARYAAFWHAISQIALASFLECP